MLNAEQTIKKKMRRQKQDLEELQFDLKVCLCASFFLLARSFADANLFSFFFERRRREKRPRRITRSSSPASASVFAPPRTVRSAWPTPKKSRFCPNPISNRPFEPLRKWNPNSSGDATTWQPFLSVLLSAGKCVNKRDWNFMLWKQQEPMTFFNRVP